MAVVRAVVGLGNPGPGHATDRHNIGFWFVDALASRGRVAFRADGKFHGETARLALHGEDLLLLKPGTYMNRSGQAAQALAAFYKIEPGEILAVHDELDLPLGTARFKRGGGPGGHNGVRSLIEHLGPDFARLRLGIGHPGHKDRVHDYVLSRPSAEQQVAMDEMLQRSLAAFDVLISGGWDKATQLLHTDIEKDGN